MSRPLPQPPRVIKKTGPAPPPKTVKRLPQKLALDQQQTIPITQQTNQQQTKQIKDILLENKDRENEKLNNLNSQVNILNIQKNDISSNIAQHKQINQQKVLNEQREDLLHMVNLQQKENPVKFNNNDKITAQITEKNNFSDELQLQKSNIQKNVVSPQIIRAPPKAPVKRVPNNPTKAGVPGMRKPLNAPKPPPPVPKQKFQTENQPVPQPKQIQTNIAFQNFTNIQNPSSQIVLLSTTSQNLNEKKQNVQNPIKQQPAEEIKDINIKTSNFSEIRPPIKMPYKAAPPAQNLNIKQLNKTSPPKKTVVSEIQDKSQIINPANKIQNLSLSEQQQQQQSSKIPSLGPINREPVPKAPNTQNKQPQYQNMPQSMHSIQKQNPLKTYNYPSSSQLAPKYASLINKVKDFSKRKQQILKDSSQSDSQVQSQTYSEIDNKKNFTKNRDNHIHSSAQSLKPIKSQFYKRQQNYQNLSINNNTQNKKQNFNPFTDQAVDNTQLFQLKNKQVKMFKPQKEQLNQNQNKQPLQFKKQDEKKIKQFTAQPIQQSFQKQSYLQQIQIKPESQQNIYGETGNAQKRQSNQDQIQGYSKQQKIQENVNKNKQKYRANSKTIIEQKQNSQIITVNEYKDHQQKLDSVIPKSIQTPSSQVLDINHRGHTRPPPPKQSLNHALPKTTHIPKIQKITTHIQNSTNQKTQFAQMSKLLIQFSNKKHEYLKNAQQLSDICSRNREQQMKKIQIINQLLLKLQQQNIKLNTRFSSY